MSSENVKVNAEGEKRDVYPGAFLSLKSSNRVEPADIEVFDKVGYNAMKAQGVVMMFALLWTRIYEMGNFRMPFKSQYAFYAVGVGLPSFLHVFYIASKTSKAIDKLDKKYTPKYYDYYINTITQNPK